MAVRKGAILNNLSREDVSKDRFIGRVLRLDAIFRGDVNNIIVRPITLCMYQLGLGTPVHMVCGNTVDIVCLLRGIRAFSLES